jgi:hypothetical protein
MEKMDRKSVPKSRWPKYFSSFTHGNRGRLIKISLFEGEREQKALEEDMPLLAVSYDSHHNGMLSISVGKDKIEYEHPISKPEKVWVDEEEGWAKSMVVMDADGNRTVLTFEE